MFKRKVDVTLISSSGEAVSVINHKDYPNTFICDGTFNRYDGTESDKLVINLYNLPATLRADISLGKYTMILVNYGYEDEPDMPPELFIGNIARRFNSGEDETSDITTLIALDTGEFASSSFFQATYADDVNIYRIADDLLREAKDNGQIESYEISEKLKELSEFGSKSYYGTGNDILTALAEQHGIQYTRTKNSIKLCTADEVINNEAILFSVYDESTGKVESRTGLINTPELTDTGITIECLVNTNISVRSVVKISNSALFVNRSQTVAPNTEYGATIDPDGLYVVNNISGKFSNDGQNNSMTLNCVSRNNYLGWKQPEEEN